MTKLYASGFTKPSRVYRPAGACSQTERHGIRYNAANAAGNAVCAKRFTIIALVFFFHFAPKIFNGFVDTENGAAVLSSCPFLIRHIRRFTLIVKHVSGCFYNIASCSGKAVICRLKHIIIIVNFRFKRIKLFFFFGWFKRVKSHFVCTSL